MLYCVDLCALCASIANKNIDIVCLLREVCIQSFIIMFRQYSRARPDLRNHWFIVIKIGLLVDRSQALRQ